MGRGETRVSDSEGVRREKVKGREKKWENLPWERRRQKIMFLTAIDENNIYRRYNAWERDCFLKNMREIVFQISFLENNL